MHFTYKIWEVHKILSLTIIRITCDLDEMGFIYSVDFFPYRLTLTLSCAMNFLIYPHDTQECKLQMESCEYSAV